MTVIGRSYFKNRLPVPIHHAFIYLGFYLSETLDLSAELPHRIQRAMATWKKLGLFWKHGNCSPRRKLIIYNALIRAKLLYGLESVQLTKSQLNRLSVFQLKGLRQILGLPTTCIDRRNTNQRVYELAQNALSKSTAPVSPVGVATKIQPFSRYYKRQKLRLLGHSFRQPMEAPERNVTFCIHSVVPKLFPEKRVGKPRLQWTLETMRKAWKITKVKMEDQLTPAMAGKFSIDNPAQLALLFSAALFYYF